MQLNENTQNGPIINDILLEFVKSLSEERKKKLHSYYNKFTGSNEKTDNFLVASMLNAINDTMNEKKEEDEEEEESEDEEEESEEVKAMLRREEEKRVKEMEEQQRWFFLPKMLLKNGKTICTYCPPRGMNKGRVCCSRSVINPNDNFVDWRCEDCKGKVGMGKKELFFTN